MLGLGYLVQKVNIELCYKEIHCKTKQIPEENKLATA